MSSMNVFGVMLVCNYGNSFKFGLNPCTVGKYKI